MMSKKPPAIVTPTAEHSSTLIFMHGLGDVGSSWTNALRNVCPRGMKIICPTAPTRPVTLSGGIPMTCWFDIISMDIAGREDEEGVEFAAQNIHALIDEERREGISAKRIVLGGFSQGGALALYAALTYRRPLGGVLALSCWLPLHRRFPGNMRNSNEMPILQIHGNSDPVVPHKYGKLTSTLLKSFLKNVTFRTYIGLSHCTSEDEMDDVRDAINHWIS